MTRIASTRTQCCLSLVFFVGAFMVPALYATKVSAWGQYSQNADATNCAQSGCHGDFRTKPYMPPSGDPEWNDDLMGAHDEVLNDCDACHSGSNRKTVFLSSSDSATFPMSCIGCHGRAEDGPAEPGAGLRQHHDAAGAFDCTTGCHTVVVPESEDVLPPNYGTLSIDPCNPGSAFSENFPANPDGIGLGGLDNDGDLLYDGNDPDCAAPECGDGILDPGEECDDGNTFDGDCCSATCQVEPPDSPCPDGMYCNGDETCDDQGTCQGTPVDCGDGVDCTVDLCNEATDSCDNTPDDAFCDNGLFCDGMEVCDSVNDCQQGTGVDCDDGVGCTEDDSCDEVNDICVNDPNDLNCPDDGLFCTGIEFCDALIDCSFTGDPCPAGTICDDATDTCEPLEGCGDGILEPPGEQCDDGNILDGDCCSALCQFEPAGSPCPDGVYCNGDETCDGAATCEAGVPVDCSDGIDCTVDSCNEATNSCDDNTPDDGLCDNGLFCDGIEVCDPVNDCSPGGDPCPDGTVCNEETDTCDTEGGGGGCQLQPPGSGRGGMSNAAPPILILLCLCALLLRERRRKRVPATSR